MTAAEESLPAQAGYFPAQAGSFPAQAGSFPAQAGWFPEQPPPSPRRSRKHGLADQVRGLIADVLLLDIEAADEEQLTEAEGLLAEARQALAALPDLRPSDPKNSDPKSGDVNSSDPKSSGLYGAPTDGHLFERSPLSGRGNALAAPLTITFDGAGTLAHAQYGEAFEGPPGSVHGGYVIAAFDELLGVAQAASGIAGLTGTLTVKLRRRTPLHRRIDYQAGVLEQTGRKVVAWGRSTLEGELLAEATGVFIQPRGGYPKPE